MADRDYDWYVQHATEYMLIGDLDKPFHLCECECEDCEQWRKDKGRPTHAELRKGDRS